jgi:putrescine:ornithine antiporter
MGNKKSKKMGVRQMTIITAVNMMGSGIILLPANLAQVGTISILSWLVTTAGATCLAYAFARAGTFSNREGGMGGYADYAHGHSGNFLTNYTYVISLVIANVAIAVATIGYGANFFGATLGPWPTAIAVIAVLWLASVLNFGGARRTGNISQITVWGVIIPVAGLCIVGWFFFSPHLFAHSWNPHHFAIFHAVTASIAVTLWAFLGLETACANTGEVENPKKNVPIAVMLGTLIAAVLYIVSTSVIGGILPGHELANSNAPFGLVFAHIFNPTIGKIVIAMMVISCFGSLFSWQFTIAEVARSSAVVGYFPKLFRHVNKAGAPILGICVITAAQTAISFMTVSPSLDKQFTVLLDLSVMTNLIPYLLSMSALMVLQHVEHVSDKLARKANIVAVLATIYCLYALHTTGTTAMVWGGIITFAGWGIYGLIANNLNARAAPAKKIPKEPSSFNAAGRATNGEPPYPVAPTPRTPALAGRYWRWVLS